MPAFFLFALLRLDAEPRSTQNGRIAVLERVAAQAKRGRGAWTRRVNPLRSTIEFPPVFEEATSNPRRMTAMPSDTYQSQQMWIKRLLSEHPAFLFTSMYVVASIIGMFFSWDFLRRFSINIFHYTEISDFMLASLKEPFTWGLVIAAVLLVAGDNALSQRAANREPGRWLRWYASPRYRKLNYLVAVLMIVIFIDAHALFKARDVYAGEGEIITVTLANGTAPSDAILLGTTGRFIFLYHRGDDRVDIHPHEAVLTIRKSQVSANISPNL